MVPVNSGRIAKWVSRVQRSFEKISKNPADETDGSSIDLSDPLVNYYRHRARVNLANFYRFAIQTRSVTIRDIFAQVASRQHLPLVDLLQAIQELMSQDLSSEHRSKVTDSYDTAVLLALADLLANTAQDDLDTYAAVQVYAFVRMYFGEEAFSPMNTLQNVEALHDLGEYEQSLTLAKTHHINDFAPLQGELLRIQRLRLNSSGVEEWLSALNKLYASLNMTQVQLLEDDSLPLLDRLSAGTAETKQGPKVSVILPTYSPGVGIRTALRGLLQQTWQNLEVIVVNDASSSEFNRIFDEIDALDPRVRVIHQEHNAGAYVARNAGLQVATGSFITTHDDDDWSHPDKIAMQVLPLLEDHALVATTSAHIRTTENLNFKRVNAEAKFLQMNYSSLMFRRSLIEEIGDWDPVNRGGDSEFYSRLVQYAGAERVLGLHDLPFSFSRIWDGSLTSGEMYRGFFGYSRLIYRAAFRQWHREKGQGGKLHLSSHDPRPYAVPTTFEAGRRNADLGRFDVIYVSDFFRQAKGVDSALNEMASLAEHGLRVGYVHLYSPETRSTFGFPDRLFALQLEGEITQISLDDTAETKLLLVYDATVGMFLDQIHANITTIRSVAIEQTLVSLADVEPRTPSFAPQALAHLDACFSTRFEIVGATEKDQHHLRGIVPSRRVAQDEMIWHTHVPDGPGEVSVPTDVPVVGFHSNSNRYRWPNTLELFQNIYVSEAYTTRFFGQVRQPLEKLGVETLDLVELVDDAAETEQEFLRSIDFWVYWPHYRLSDQIWEPVLSALRAGKVVILPRSLEPLYGNAAVYAAEGQVGSLISFYAANPESYLEQAERAQDFIAQTYTKDSLLHRVTMLMK